VLKKLKDQNLKIMSHLKKIPIISGFLRRIEADVAIHGWQGAARKLVEYSHTKLEIAGQSPKLIKILTENAGLIIANHPYEAETIALIAALPKRPDAYLVVNKIYQGLMPLVDKHMIPVHIRHHYHKKNKQYSLNRFIEILHKTPMLTEEEEHHHNRKSIAEAANKIKKGGLVIIYPGKRHDNGKWYDGVGHLVNQIGYSKNTSIIFVHAQGTSNWDYLRMLPFTGKLLPKVTLNFSTAYAINKFNSQKPKKIRENLEIAYNNWANTLIIN
jgi:hypothetical protein